MKNRKNLWKLLVFPLVLFLFFSPLLLCGELMSPNLVLAAQPFLGDKFLYGMAYTNNIAHYKLRMINRRKADVIAIGNSRVLQFHDYFFNDDTSFYNGGSIAASLPACLATLQNIEPDALPEVVILGLDTSFFSESYTLANHAADTAAFLQPYDYKTINLLYDCLASDYKKGKFKLWQIVSQAQRIGVNAKVNGNGYRQDGSYCYQNVYDDPQTAKLRIAPKLKEIKEGSGRFAGGDEPYAVSLDSLQQIIDFCKEKQIDLIAFTPPFSNAAMDCIRQRTDIDFIPKIAPAVRPMLENAGFEFYDYTDPAVLSLTDDSFVDAFHGSDCAYLRITIEMLRKGSRLNEYANLAAIEALYAGRISDLEIH